MEIIELRSKNEGFTWLDITGPTIEELTEVSKQYNLNNHNLLDCMEPDHLPKFEEDDDFNFIILRKVLSNNPKGNNIHSLSTKIAIFYNDKTIVTIHRLPQPDVFNSCEQFVTSGKATSVNQLLLKIIAKVQMSYTEFAQKLNHQIDSFETRLFARKTTTESIESLYMLKRRTGLCRRLLLLTGEVVSALQHRQKKSNELQDIRDAQAKLQLYYDQLIEDAINMVSTYMSYNAQKTNEVMKVLTIFSAFFLPLTFIVGIYGMNFDIMPELRWRYGYLMIMLVMLLIFIVIYTWFKRRRWL
ncbi:MAG: CorA family divalent cation transporter [bacterium]